MGVTKTNVEPNLHWSVSGSSVLFEDFQLHVHHGNKNIDVTFPKSTNPAFWDGLRGEAAKGEQDFYDYIATSQTVPTAWKNAWNNDLDDDDVREDVWTFFKSAKAPPG